MRTLVTLAISVAVSLPLLGCGWGGGDRDRGGVVLRYADGPIHDACLASDRKRRSRALCGCIQAVANGRLDRGDQRLAVSFYRDPHRAQEIRQSDRPSDRDFWRRYSSMGDEAERVCRGL